MSSGHLVVHQIMLSTEAPEPISPDVRHLQQSVRKNSKALGCEEGVIRAEISIDELEDIAVANIIPLPYDLDVNLIRFYRREFLRKISLAGKSQEVYRHAENLGVSNETIA